MAVERGRQSCEVAAGGILVALRHGGLGARRAVVAAAVIPVEISEDLVHGVFPENLQWHCPIPRSINSLIQIKDFRVDDESCLSLQASPIYDRTCGIWRHF